MSKAGEKMIAGAKEALAIAQGEALPAKVTVSFLDGGTLEIDPANYAPGTCGMHEAMDRAHLCVEFVSNNLLDHPAISLNPGWKARVEDVLDLLSTLYGSIAEVHCA